MVTGYCDDAALTAASFFDGWFQTGDIGLIPAPAQLLVLGRSEDQERPAAAGGGGEADRRYQRRRRPDRRQRE
jgi:acyl-CoA synthetase (AMP-forming)/AMP-acid ligase II